MAGGSLLVYRPSSSGRGSSSPRAFGLAAVVVALALDQAHKFWMLHVFDIGQRQPIRLTPFLDLVLSWNFGVSYSLLSSQTGATRALLVAFQLSIVGCLAYWLWRARDG